MKKTLMRPILWKMKTNPQRMCTVCRSMKDKRDLIRIVMYNGEISLDETGKKNGRGAYLCKNTECINKAKKSNVLAKVFKCQVDKSIYDGFSEKYG